MNQKKTVDSIITDQRVRYRETLTTGTVTVPAGGEVLVDVKISSLGAFACEEITGNFTTLEIDGGAITDTGVTKLSLTMADGSNALPLTNDFVPVDTLLSPGRVKDSAAVNNLTTANPSGFLIRNLPFRYSFAKLSSIQVRVRNTSTADNRITLAFHGSRLRG